MSLLASLVISVFGGNSLFLSTWNLEWFCSGESARGSCSPSPHRSLRSLITSEDSLRTIWTKDRLDFPKHILTNIRACLHISTISRPQRHGGVYSTIKRTGLDLA